MFIHVTQIAGHTFVLPRFFQLVMSVGKDLAHSMAVFHWRSRTTLFTAPSGPEAVLGCHVVNENLFVSCGVDHLQLWTRTGGTFEGERGEWLGQRNISTQYHAMAMCWRRRIYGLDKRSEGQSRRRYKRRLRLLCYRIVLLSHRTIMLASAIIAYS